MKKSKLEAVLRRKVRIKITRRKRGRFRVWVPAGLNGTAGPVAMVFLRKREAMTWLFTFLRCLQSLTVQVDHIGKEIK